MLSLRSLLLEGHCRDRYSFFVTESKGNSLYCYVVDKVSSKGAMFRVSDHRAMVFAEDVDFGTIYYKDHLDIVDVALTVYQAIQQEDLLREQVKITIQEFKVLEYLLYLNLSGYKLRVDVEKRKSSTYLVGMSLDSDYAGVTIQSENFFMYTGLDKLVVGDKTKVKGDLDLAVKNRFYELVDLENLRSLITKGVLTVFHEQDYEEANRMVLGDVYRLNLNAKGLYYVSSAGLGVEVLRGITLSTWYTKYSMDLLLDSRSWQVRDKVGVVKWY